jgi:hypothetical protein
MRFRLRTLLISLVLLAMVLSFGYWLWYRSMQRAVAQMEMVIEQGYIDEDGIPRRKRQVIKNPFDESVRRSAKKQITRIQLVSADIPYSIQLQMQPGDAYAYALPNGKTIAVWCEQPSPLGALFSDDSKSGLDISWGEKPFKQPSLVRKGTGPDPDQLVWESYITQGAVVYSGDRTREHELFIGDLRLSILLDLTAKGALPVTIAITRKQPSA